MDLEMGMRGSTRPFRFRVTIVSVDDETFDYRVVTWFGRDKAIAWAALVHKSAHGGHGMTHRVRVEELGPAVPGEGEGELQGDGYTDRSEW